MLLFFFIGGNQIEAECQNFLREKGISEMPVGSVFVSNAGNLLCKKVIHAVGPRWMGGRENEDNDLY